jgi:hypothetical protein
MFHFPKKQKTNKENKNKKQTKQKRLTTKTISKGPMVRQRSVDSTKK